MMSDYLMPGVLSVSSLLKYKVFYIALNTYSINDPSFWTDRPVQPEEQSDQGLYCLQFGLYLFEAIRFK